MTASPRSRALALRGRSSRAWGRACLVAALVSYANAAHSEPANGLTGRVTVENTHFPREATSDVVRTKEPPIGFLTLDWSAHGAARNAQWGVRARPRWTAARSDDPRRGFRWDELYVQLLHAPFELKVGFLQEHWGVLETRQLVDLINTYDNLDGLIPEKKLAQRAIKAGVRLGIGQLDVYHFLSDFEPLRFYPEPSRFVPYRIAPEPQYLEGADPGKPGQAARYWIAGDDLDIGISFFRGIDRQPRFAVGSTGWVAQYEQVRQFGVDATWVIDRSTLKLETLHHRSVNGNAEGKGWRRSIGAEYAFPRAIGSADLSLVAEYHHDDIGTAVPVSTFDRKLLLAGRVELNDLTMSSAFVGWMQDLSTRGNQMLMLRLDIGLTDDTRLGLAATLPRAAANDAQWQALEQAGNLRLEISHAFAL